MTSPSADDARVVELITAYLDIPAHAPVRAWVLGPQPLVQRVALDPAAWRTHFARIEASLGDGPTAEGLAAALDEIEDHRSVTRQILERLSVDATSPAAAVTLWIATMCWGSKNPRNWRLTQWTRSVDDALAERLWAILGQLQQTTGNTPDDVLDPMTTMYRATLDMDGVGESYGTKWLWGAGLDPKRDFPVQPLVLDRRVRGTLQRLGWLPVGATADERYVDYCQACPRWAGLLNGQIPGGCCDAYRIEQLLFDRPERPGSTVSKPPTLFEWLP